MPASAETCGIPYARGCHGDLQPSPSRPSNELPVKLTHYRSFCFARPGKERPSTFESKEGSGHNLLVLKRVKDSK